VRSNVARGKEQLRRVADTVAALNPDRPWRITIGEYRSKRSPEQNNLLWKIYTEIAGGTGHTPEDVHEALKKLFLPPRQIVIGEVRVPVAGSTAGLDVHSFSEYVERVQSWAASELGIVVLDQGE